MLIACKYLHCTDGTSTGPDSTSTIERVSRTGTARSNGTASSTSTARSTSRTIPLGVLVPSFGVGPIQTRRPRSTRGYVIGNIRQSIDLVWLRYD